MTDEETQRWLMAIEEVAAKASAALVQANMTDDQAHRFSMWGTLLGAARNLREGIGHERLLADVKAVGE